MTVYVVEYYEYGQSYVVGVFLSEQGAQKAIEEYKKQDKEEGNDWDYSYNVYDVQD